MWFLGHEENRTKLVAFFHWVLTHLRQDFTYLSLTTTLFFMLAFYF